MKYRALPNYLLVAFCAAAPAVGQSHPPYPCHAGESWSWKYPNAVDGDFIHIYPYETVILDVTTPKLSGLLVEGNLVFNHASISNTVHLNSAYVVVTGSLQIGCKSLNGVITRFMKKTSITLVKPEHYLQQPNLPPLIHGVAWPNDMISLFGTSGDVYEAALDRGLVVVGAGELYIYGNDSRVVGWTTLSTTANISDSFIALDDTLTDLWKDGDEIVLASTDFEYADQYPQANLTRTGGHLDGYRQGEERVIQDFSTPFLQLNLPLAKQHWSETTTVNFNGVPSSVSEKCEVANLTRSVVIQGEFSQHSSTLRGGTQHLGHVTQLPLAGLTPYCEVDWTEFRNLGVEGKLGRYPFHWHMLGDASEEGVYPYLKNSSIHHCVNRFVSVHNTQRVRLEGNVGYWTRGSGFFLEDADEYGNPMGEEVQYVIMTGNLGMRVDRPEAYVNFSQEFISLDKYEPSVFWIQHPNQQIEGNHAAGAAGHGFYLAPDKLLPPYSHPPSTALEGSFFRNNVAHSNGQNGFYHQSRIRWDWVPGDAPAGEGLVAWKNRRYGIWWRTYGTSLLAGCSAANNKSGLYPASEGRQDAHDGSTPPTCLLMVDDCTIFGETENRGEKLNPAEIAATRSLPQTYWNFTRSDLGSFEHEKKWDSINAVESYDGQNVFTNLRITLFPATRTLPNPEPGGGQADQVVAGLTQVEYNSKFAEDPRNELSGLEFVNVFNPVRYRTTLASNNYSMVRNTVMYDVDGSLGYGSNVYITYLDEFFRANASGAGTGFTTPNILVLPTGIADFAQFQINATQLAPNVMTVSVTDGQGIVRSQTLGAMPPEPMSSTKDFVFNAPIGVDPAHQYRKGVYTCDFGGALATGYEIKIQFAEAAGLATIIGVPLSTTPSSLFVNVTNILPNIELTLNSLISSQQANAYFYDSAAFILYIRTTTTVLGPNGLALDGTRNVIKVN